MKINIYKAISIAALASTIISCQGPEDPYQGLFPADYKSILYIKGDSMTPLDLPDLATSNEYIYDFSVIKAGSDPKAEADANLKILSQEEIVAKYGNEYTILPNDTWSISSTDMHFTSEDKSKDFEIKFIPKKVKELLGKDDKKLCIAFELQSTSDSVNINKNRVLINIKSVNAPRINFVEPDRIIVFQSKRDAAAKINLSAKLEGITTNPWNFTCKVGPSSDQKLIDKFTKEFHFDASDVNTTPLKATFSSNMFSFMKNDCNSQEKVSITVDPKTLEEGKISILPTVLSESSMDGIISPEEVRYVSAIIPTAPERITLTGDMLFSTHGHSDEGRHLEYLLDENFDTYWHADYDGKVICEQGLGFDINLTKFKKMFHTFKISYHTRRGYNINPSKIVFYGSTNGDDWFEISALTMKEDNLPVDQDAEYESKILYSLHGFNRLRIAVPESYNIGHDTWHKPGSGISGDTYVISEFRLWAK